MFKFFSKEIIDDHIKIKIFGMTVSIKQRKLLELPYLETHVVDHCNLNCSGCSHYCPVTPKRNIDVKKFEKDLRVLSKKFKISRFFLMGGEPLLHPEINKFIALSRKYFPTTEICVLTNGTLLKKKDEMFWETLRQNDVKIGLTKYPATKDYFNELEELVRKNNVNIGAIHEGMRFAYRLSKKAKVEDFQYCPTKICTNLRNGRLYVCSIGCYLDNYNRYFKTNYPIEKGISIRLNSAERILKYLKTPSVSCSVCMAKEEDWQWKDWASSKRVAEEWFID